MDKKVLIIIDTEAGFVYRFNEQLDIHELLDQYRTENIIPNTSKDRDQVMRQCLEEVKSLVETTNVSAIFVDIVIFESGESDSFGIDIAENLKSLFSHIPVFNVTAKHTSLSDVNAISRASLANTDAVLLKGYLTDKGFTRKRLKKILNHKNLIVNSDIKLEVTNKSEISPEMQEIANKFSITDARVTKQINEIGVGYFWSLISKIHPGLTGTISYISPGRSGAYVFLLKSQTKVPGQPTSMPKHWILKISNDFPSLENEVLNYADLRENTPLPKNRYPQLWRDEVINGGAFGAILLELQEEADTLSKKFSSLNEVGMQTVLSGIRDFFETSYGDLNRSLAHPWHFYEKFYSDPFIIDILSAIASFEDIYKLHFEPQGLETLRNFLMKNGSIYDKIKRIEVNLDQRFIHGDFNAGNILLNDDNEPRIIDFSARKLGHVVFDAAKLERDIVFRVFDANTSEFYDWSRINHWSNFTSLITDSNFFDENFVGIEGEPSLNSTFTFIKGLRNQLKFISDKITEEEYLLSLLYFTTLAILHPEFSFQKRLYAVYYASKILDRFN
jgi:hypothetical protein